MYTTKIVKFVKRQINFKKFFEGDGWLINHVKFNNCTISCSKMWFAIGKYSRINIAAAQSIQANYEIAPNFT